jgi:hypothetical protein
LPGLTCCSRGPLPAAGSTRHLVDSKMVVAALPAVLVIAFSQEA